LAGYLLIAMQDLPGRNWVGKSAERLAWTPLAGPHWLGVMAGRNGPTNYKTWDQWTINRRSMGRLRLSRLHIIFRSRSPIHCFHCFNSRPQPQL
jgi:hypothetical protein